MTKTRITIDVDRAMTPEEVLKAQDILIDLVECGALFGVRGGQAILHFDAETNYMGTQLNYWPRRRKKKEKPHGY